MASDWFPLLGADAGIGARRIDEGHQRQTKSLRQPHQAQSLAIALGLGHAVVAAHALLGVAALLVTDEHHRAILEPRGTADDGEIVAIHAIAMQLLEVFEDETGVVERVGTLRVARQLCDLPGRQVRENGLRELFALLLEAGDFFLDVDRGARGNMFQFLDFGFQLGDGLLEIEKVDCHGREDNGVRPHCLAWVARASPSHRSMLLRHSPAADCTRRRRGRDPTRFPVLPAARAWDAHSIRSRRKGFRARRCRNTALRPGSCHRDAAASNACRRSSTRASSRVSLSTMRRASFSRSRASSLTFLPCRRQPLMNSSKRNCPSISNS